jgi:transposase
MKNFKTFPIRKQSVGIDVASDKLDVRLGAISTAEQMNFSPSRRFSNCSQGFHRLLEWVQTHVEDTESVWFIMEATGVYYEELAYFLHQAGCQVCVLVASRAKHYAQSLPVKSKTDAIDARILARYGLERSPDGWHPAGGQLRRIKLLVRERHQLKKQRTQLKNRLHAAHRRWQHPDSSLKRLTDHIERINEYLRQIGRELDRLWQSDRQLSEPIKRIAQIGGIGRKTVLEILAETNGFALITNRNQLASYAGLDVVIEQSGKRVGASKISKQGNVYIRQILYMPAVCASQHNRALQAFYNRLVARHPGRKKIALVAVMRKLLLLIYSLWKSGREYNPAFHYRQITGNA